MSKGSKEDMEKFIRNLSSFLHDMSENKQQKIKNSLHDQVWSYMQ